jgi:hypothetical protein
VVRLNLDDCGKVSDVRAISGQEILTERAMANARKWQFEPNSRKAAVLVYNFRIATGFCHSSFSIFEPPNFITVTACPDVASIN